MPFRDFDEQSAASWYQYLHEQFHEQTMLVDDHSVGEGDDLPSRAQIESAMVAEMNHVLQHKIFRKSQTLSQLLKWLLRETLAGRGELVKNYTIGLHGFKHFENSDRPDGCHPETQMGRLQRALELYYGQSSRKKGRCLYVLHNTYQVRFAELEKAYPNLHSIVADTEAQAVTIKDNRHCRNYSARPFASLQNMSDLWGDMANKFNSVVVIWKQVSTQRGYSPRHQRHIR